jgi:hypothetical protein
MISPGATGRACAKSFDRDGCARKEKPAISFERAGQRLVRIRTNHPGYCTINSGFLEYHMIVSCGTLIAELLIPIAASGY